jgi:hypothetical protein
MVRLCEETHRSSMYAVHHTRVRWHFSEDTPGCSSRGKAAPNAIARRTAEPICRHVSPLHSPPVQNEHPYVKISIVLPVTPLQIEPRQAEDLHSNDTVRPQLMKRW